MYSRCLECSGNYLQCKQVASQLPAHHKHVFDYLTGNMHTWCDGLFIDIVSCLFQHFYGK